MDYGEVSLNAKRILNRLTIKTDQQLGDTHSEGMPEGKPCLVKFYFLLQTPRKARQAQCREKERNNVKMEKNLKLISF